jgi:hypothetical protein
MTMKSEQNNRPKGQLTLLVVAAILMVIFAWRHVF